MESGKIKQFEAGVWDRRSTFDEWISKYGDGVLKLAYLYLKDQDLAEDVFQETFTRVYINMDRFRGESSPKTWIYRITTNLCRDRRGNWAARKIRLMGEDVLFTLLGGISHTEADALAAIDAEVLLQAVLQLPVEFRAVILLAYYEGMDLKDVGTVLGLPSGTVRSRMHRARQKLKTLLMERGWRR